MRQSNNIRKLDKAVAEKIAAGEVINRPLSAVKELLENAVDAGAKTIAIEIKDGGKSYIRVTDDGCGIPEAELPLAFERHATSKIRNIEDIFGIFTLGFRGEALTSISTVSRVEVITKPAHAKIGSRIYLEGGIIKEHRQTGCPDGTTAIVRDLFFNTPAREKFLKSKRTESSLIIDFVSKFSLAYPSIRIRLINNGVTLFSTSGTGDILHNIQTIYSKDISNLLLLAQGKTDDYELLAYISPPDKSRASRKHQVCFVNGRIIKSRLFDEALAIAYKERLDKGRHPAAFLFLKANPDHLDINIHPNKREIRFENNDVILTFMIKCFLEALSASKAIPKLRPAGNIFEEKMYSGKESKNSGSQDNITSLLSTKRNSIEMEMPKKISERASDYSVWDNLNVTGTLFNTYITATDETHFYLFDQHAAHERVLYEKLLATYEKEQKKDVQILISPIIKEVTPALSNDIMELIKPLLNMGFDILEFGIKTIMIRGIPTFMTISEAEVFLLSYFDQTGKTAGTHDPLILSKIIMKACKNAVKAKEKLSKAEREQLIRDLAKAKQPYSCPHGRPTLIKLSRHEIEKMFQRI